MAYIFKFQAQRLTPEAETRIFSYMGAKYYDLNRAEFYACTELKGVL
jgi:hypothetical protein